MIISVIVIVWIRVIFSNKTLFPKHKEKHPWTVSTLGEVWVPGNSKPIKSFPKLADRTLVWKSGKIISVFLKHRFTQNSPRCFLVFEVVIIKSVCLVKTCYGYKVRLHTFIISCLITWSCDYPLWPFMDLRRMTIYPRLPDYPWIRCHRSFF